MAEVVVQKLERIIANKVERAIRYYSIYSVLNNIGLTKKQIELLAFTAVRGTITPMSARQEFASLFNSSVNSVENLKGQLVGMGLMVKIGEMYKVEPMLELDFSHNLLLQISIKGQEDEGKQQ